MFNNPGTYANKKRKKPVLKQKKVLENNEVVKSNPSKRHRDRLNGELDRLMDLLPFPEEVRSRLDKLSVLRLSVGYLRVKSFFKATMKNSSGSRLAVGVNGQSLDTAGCSEGDLLLQALNGFVLAVMSEGLVFYASPTIQDYLGFHQSDVIHQSVFDLIHTDDRALFREQLHFALNPPPAAADEEGSCGCGNAVMYSAEQLPPDNSSFLERSFVCRFRCLLDNSSGFLALKFQGRLKYLHGPNTVRDSGSGSKVQLALFAVAVPAQPPAIVEIRAKMLLFQTKHKLDFTPMGVDSRGKIILGYSEAELCMKGSGYQFIHAADMMYCADNHIRMIKTGESGLTVFRLLSRSNSWVWVKANAKLIYKGGRPEFIIAYQKALTNAEGEEYLRQRRMQLPFSCSTGEAILYSTNQTMDIPQFQFNKMFDGKDAKKDVFPSSLLDCFLRQDETIYSQTPEAPLPVDQVFMDSHALVSVASNSWQDNEAPATEREAVLGKEAKPSVMAVIDSLEKLSQEGEFDAVLQHLDVDDADPMEWENCLKRFHQEEDPQMSMKSDLDSIIPDDIIDFIDTVFKEKEEEALSSLPRNCHSGVNSCTPPELCEPQLFQAPAPDGTYSPVNGHYAHQDNGPMIGEHSLVVSGNQKLSHQGPVISQPDSSLPPLQQLQLKDIFTPSIELPELTVPNISADESFSSLFACRQASFRPTSRPQGGSILIQQPNQLLSHPAGLQVPTLTGAGPMLQSSVRQPPLPAVTNTLPPLVSCNDYSSSSSSTLPVGRHTQFLQQTVALETHNNSLYQWPPSQALTHPTIMQNGHGTVPTFQNQNTQNLTFPHAAIWPGLGEQGGRAAPHSSCMFGQHFSSPDRGDVLSHREPSDFSRTDVPLDQGPSQAPRYFQWSHAGPVNGTSAVNQESATISPPTATPGVVFTQHSHNIQHYPDSNTPTQGERVSSRGGFVRPAVME
uniref:Aryl hydrocarbon receptor n=3 Tax=Nothobranchius TaxID=28779 RepID=A0A1A8VBH9_NOTFU